MTGFGSSFIVFLGFRVNQAVGNVAPKPTTYGVDEKSLLFLVCTSNFILVKSLYLSKLC